MAHRNVHLEIDASMSRSMLRSYRVEELAIYPQSPWANQPLKDLPIYSEYRLLVVAARGQDSSDFHLQSRRLMDRRGTPDADRARQADDVSLAREIAQQVDIPRRSGRMRMCKRCRLNVAGNLRRKAAWYVVSLERETFTEFDRCN